jgi:hypothetical protein
MMSRPKVSYTDLELAFDAPSSNYVNMLDTQTGEVLSYESEIEDELLMGGDLAAA